MWPTRSCTIEIRRIPKAREREILHRTRVEGNLQHGPCYYRLQRPVSKSNPVTNGSIVILPLPLNLAEFLGAEELEMIHRTRVEEDLQPGPRYHRLQQLIAETKLLDAGHITPQPLNVENFMGAENLEKIYRTRPHCDKIVSPRISRLQQPIDEMKFLTSRN